MPKEAPNLKVLRAAIASAAREAQHYPSDPGAEIRLARARETYIVEKALNQVTATIGGAELSPASKRRLANSIGLA